MKATAPSMLEAALALSMPKTLTPQLYQVVRCIVKLGSYELQAIVDAGAFGSTVSHMVARRLGLFNFLENASYNFLTSSGEQHTPMGLLHQLPVTIDEFTLPVDATVTKVESYGMMVGQDWLTPASAIINVKDRVLSIRKDRDTRVTVPWSCGMY